MTQPTPQPMVRLGTSTYSYWHFLPEKTPIETVLDEAHKLGLHGIEILQRQLASEESSYFQKLKRHAFHLGLDIYNLSIHQDFVWETAEERHGGQTISENLALACSTCNEFKGTDLGSLDWESKGDFEFFFNPRTQIWTEHFQIEANGEIIPLTAEARVTVRILRFNDEARIEERRELIEAGLY